MKKLYFLLFIGFLFFQTNTFSQDNTSGNRFFLPDGLGLSNQLKYSYDQNLKREIFEDWLNVDYIKGIFSAGIRFETFQPNDPNPAISRGKTRYADIAYKYFKVNIGNAQEGAELTVGNFYELFGRGLVLKSYEDRNIRVDNNLLGVKIAGNYANFILTALTGMPANSDNNRTDILHAVDLEYDGLNFLKLGGSFASNQPDVDGVARTRLTSVRIEPSIWNIDMYGEYTIKQNDDIKDKIFNGSKSIAGRGFYGNMNLYVDKLAFTGEYKYYDNISFKSNDNTVDYNTPPAERKEYSYVLVNRHPSPLNADNEQGFEFQLDYNLSDETYFSANYGKTKTLPPSSYYQMVNKLNIAVRTQLEESFIQATHDWSDHLTTVAALGYNKELDTDTKNITPILENRFYFGDVNSINLTLEHQQSKNNITEEEYFDDVVTLEYLRSPNFSVSVVSEMQTREPEAGRKIRKFWNFIQFGYKVGYHTDLTLLIGSRQAGNICIGGVCRYEPEFSGVELKMLTRL